MTQTGPQPQPDTTAQFLLDSLKDAHDKLLGAIEELKVLTMGPPPSSGALVTARWNLSKASLDRRLLWGRIHLHLAKRVDSKSEHDLRRLQDIDMQLLRSSSTHVTKWTPDSIMEDWAGYCMASGIMRDKMVEAMQAEVQLLYPVLESLARGY